LMLKRMVRVL